MIRISAFMAATALVGAAAFSLIDFTDRQTDRADRLAQLLDPAQSASLACRGNKPSALAALLSTSVAHASEGEGYAESERPPLFPGLGTASIAISTDAPMAQAYFDQGLKFAFGFNHAEAARAFRAAQAIDPLCAMCYWGEALVLGPNINAPMTENAHVPAIKALAMAKSLKDDASPREQALIGALDERYGKAFAADRSAYDAAYADAMFDVADRFANQDFIQILAAEAAMDTQPWNYWEPGGETPRGRTEKAIALIERVLDRTPEHPGAIHLYIHLMEASAKPEKAEPHADVLAGQMPAAGHIVHMPSHLYYRIGRYVDSIRANVKAVAADEAYFEMAGRDGIYGYGYYPHNVHFVLTSAQMAGDKATAMLMAEKLKTVVSEEAAKQAAWLQPIVAAPYFARAQFADAQSLMDLPKPDESLPYVHAAWHYARGMGHVLAGNGQEAQGEVTAIRTIMEETDFSAEVAGGLPAPTVLDLAAHVLEGRISIANDEASVATSHFGAAVKLQDSLPYMEPPFWYYPVRQSMGAAQMMAGEHDAAVTTLRQSLFDAPNNGYALYALAMAEEARGDKKAAKAARKAWKSAWAGDRAPELGRM